MITVVIAEDHAVTRQGLRSILEEQMEARVAAATGDGLAVIDLVEEHQPDVLLLDLSLPGLNGLEVLRRVHDRFPEVCVIVLSMHSEDSYVVRALYVGASAYVLKGAATDELIEAIETAQKGDIFISAALPDRLIEEALRGEGDRPRERYEMLTDREREVLQLVAEGYTSQEIGEKLFISRRTVDKHRENLMAKLELSNHAALVRYALQRGLIPLDPRESDGNSGDA